MQIVTYLNFIAELVKISIVPTFSRLVFHKRPGNTGIYCNLRLVILVKMLFLQDMRKGFKAIAFVLACHVTKVRFHRNELGGIAFAIDNEMEACSDM